MGGIAVWFYFQICTYTAFANDRYKYPSTGMQQLLCVKQSGKFFLMNEGLHSTCRVAAGTTVSPEINR